MGSERKVLNKYFPPEYDPSKIPRVKRLGGGLRQYNIRTMAPFNMRCNTCNGYIYKARKFNSRMEQAEDVNYLGLRHYRFYVRCTTCCAEIIWRTDLEKQDYVIESGAKRSFEALKTAEEIEAKLKKEEDEEIVNNPMKLMEKRTEQSRQEMETSEMLEDIKELNKRQAGFQSDYMLLRNLWKQKEDEEQSEKDAENEFIKQCLAARDEKPLPIATSTSTLPGQDTFKVPNVVKAAVSGSKRPPSFADLKKNGATAKKPLVVKVEQPKTEEETKSDNPLGLADYSSSDSD